MSLPTTRRVFMMALAASGTGLARAQSRVEEDSEQAAALGYKHDTTKVDKAKYPKHEASQHCANCSFWQGAAADPWAGCAMFGRKQIAAAGWCLAWNKKPG